ncbi:TC3A transposase, partial [Pseudoatta argentina]
MRWNSEERYCFFSDEAHFHLCESANKQNMRYWADTNPRVLHQRPLHSPKVTVWCAISSAGIIGPWFFEENEVAVTVNSDRYLNMLQEFFFPRLNELDLGDIWFQQDGATAHTSRASMAVLREHFPERLISIRGDLEWQARSPDLTPCDFFLWGFLKSRVYVNRPSTLQDLKTNIQEEIANITPAMLARVMTNARNRIAPDKQLLLSLWRFATSDSYAVCDHTRYFTHIYVENVGSVHDSRVSRLSSLQEYILIFVSYDILECCVLYNICLLQKDELENMQNI